MTRPKRAAPNVVEPVVSENSIVRKYCRELAEVAHL